MATAEGLRSLLDRLHTKHGAPAAVGALFGRGSLDALEVVGHRRRGGDDPALTTDAWHIGSCGKGITAALYGRLVEEGKAEWGVPLADLFPDLDAVNGWATPTIDDLLHCRAGVAANPPRRSLPTLFASDDPAPEQRTNAAAEILGAEPAKPGSFVYSNLSYVMAGAAIDRLAGVPYEEALHTYLLHPLGVTSVGFGAPEHVLGHRARVRIGFGRGPTIEADDPHADNPVLLTPAGRMHLTMTDWVTVLQMFLGNGPLAAETIDHVLRSPSGPEAKGRSMSMGFGPLYKRPAMVGAQGSNTLWAATALLDRERGVGVAVVANDGRVSVLRRSIKLAVELLES